MARRPRGRRGRTSAPTCRQRARWCSPGLPAQPSGTRHTRVHTGDRKEARDRHPCWSRAFHESRPDGSHSRRMLDVPLVIRWSDRQAQRPLGDGDQLTTPQFPSAAGRTAVAAALPRGRLGERHHHRVECSRRPGGHSRSPHPAERHGRRPPRGRRGLRAGRSRDRDRGERRRRRLADRRRRPVAPVRSGAQSDHRHTHPRRQPRLPRHHRRCPDLGKDAISTRTRPLPRTGSGCPRPAPSPGACGGTAAL